MLAHLLWRLGDMKRHHRRKPALSLDHRLISWSRATYIPTLNTLYVDDYKHTRNGEVCTSAAHGRLDVLVSSTPHIHNINHL